MKNHLLILMSVLAILLISPVTKAICQTEKPKPDTTLVLSLPALDRQIDQLKNQLEKEQKVVEDATKAADQSKQNVIQIQSILRALDAVKQDKSLHVESKKK